MMVDNLIPVKNCKGRSVRQSRDEPVQKEASDYGGSGQPGSDTEGVSDEMCKGLTRLSPIPIFGEGNSRFRGEMGKLLEHVTEKGFHFFASGE
jgi:hypothetical protein